MTAAANSGARGHPRPRGRPAPNSDVDTARRALLDAAHELLGSASSAAVGIEALAARAGTSKMAIYREFGGKDPFLTAYLQREAEIFNLWFQQRMADGPAEPLARLLFVFDVVEAFVTAADFHGCRFINASSDARDNSGLRTSAWRVKQDFRSTLASLARDAGLADPASVAVQLSLLVDGVLVAMMMSAKNDPQSLHAARAAARSIIASTPHRTHAKSRRREPN